MNSQEFQGETLLALEEWLTTRGPLPPRELFKFLRQLAVQLSAQHEQGFLCGEVTAQNIVISSEGKLRLRQNSSSAGAMVALMDEMCPPELRDLGPSSIPRELEAAAQVLASAGVRSDPRRIDVYQLGVLAVRVVTGGSVEDYLLRPRVSAKIPSQLRPVVDRAIGISPSHRFANCEQFLLELDAAKSPAMAVAPVRETPSRGVSISSDTDRIKLEKEKAQKRAGNIQPDDSLPFLRLGQYEIVARLGSGGMGDVFKGYDSSLDRFVAIKVLPSEFTRHEEFVARFRAEATAAAKVEHPNIVPIYSIDSDEGRHYFAMQFVDGQTLAQLLANDSQLKPERAMQIIEQVVSGLAVAHRFGLVHRDIKPGNILLADGGRRALLADFGLVKSISQENRMTATGIVMGTVDYISPEQGRGKPVDGRSDLYSIGVLFYQLLAGKLPFAADTPTAMIFQHAYEPPPPLREAVPHVPPLLARIIHRLLAKSASDRYQSGEELLTDLAAFRAGKPPPNLAAADRKSEAKSSVIVTPKFADDELSVLPQPTFHTSQPVPLESRSIWHDAKQYLFSWLRKQAPLISRQLEDTQQQVDGAVFEYQQRCDLLGNLLREAQEVQRLLETQLQEHQSAAASAKRRMAGTVESQARAAARTDYVESEKAAAEIQKQRERQLGELQAIQIQFTSTSAKLASLKAQRDSLQARLKAARAIAPTAGKSRNQGTLSPLAIGLVISAVASIVVVGIVAIYGLTRGNPAKVPLDKQISSAPIVPETPPTPAPPEPIKADIPPAMNYWSFDDVKNDVVKDLQGQNEAFLGFSGKGRPRLIQGKLGNALEFNSPEQIVTTDKYIDYPQLTITFWLKVNDFRGVNPRIAHPWVNLYFESKRGVGVLGSVVDPRPPQLGQWEHYAVAIDQTQRTAVIYRNGVVAASGSIQVDRDKSEYWAFGHNQDPRNSRDTLYGVLDEIRLYNRLLSREQVAQLASQAAN